MNRIGMTSAISVLGLAALLSACATVGSLDTFRYGFSNLKLNTGGTGVQGPVAEDFQLRADKWEHEWRCYGAEDCKTEFEARLFVFDKRTGRRVRWNRIEVFQADNCSASPEDRYNYKTIADADVVPLGWEDERQGRYERLSAFIVFYADWGSVDARFRTLACP
jgi:hypothetical protein